MRSLSALGELRTLGLRLTVDVAREAAQRLKNGETRYSLYGGSEKIVAKATANKLHGLFEAGDLDFLLEASAEVSFLDRASEDAEAAAPPRLDLGELVSPRSALYDRALEVMPLLPEEDWNIEALETIGISTNDGLAIMVELSELTSPERLREWSRRELVRYVEFHYVASFAKEDARRSRHAPRELIRMAAHYYAVGLVNNNEFMKKVARDILKYQVWRGSSFLDAFEKAQTATRRAAKLRRQGIMRDIAQVLSEEGTENPT